MKRRELIRKITSTGCVLVRHGSHHDLYKNPKPGKRQPIPRHDEIDDNLANHIMKELA
jgi:predicted RNA binding protein YcfA (HicA-like mRNA interferase family)